MIGQGTLNGHLRYHREIISKPYIPVKAKVMTLFSLVTYQFFNKARVFDPGMPFQPSLIFREGRSLPKCST